MNNNEHFFANTQQQHTVLSPGNLGCSIARTESSLSIQCVGINCATGDQYEANKSRFGLSEIPIRTAV